MFTKRDTPDETRRTDDRADPKVKQMQKLKKKNNKHNGDVLESLSIKIILKSVKTNWGAALVCYWF